MQPGTMNLRAAIKNLDTGQKLFLKGQNEGFLITNVRGTYILTHNNKKLIKTKKVELAAKAVLSARNETLKGIHPKADRKLLRDLGLSPEIVIP